MTSGGGRQRRIRREIHAHGRPVILILPRQTVQVEGDHPLSGYFAELLVCPQLNVQTGLGAGSGEPLDVRTGFPERGMNFPRLMAGLRIQMSWFDAILRNRNEILGRQRPERLTGQPVPRSPPGPRVPVPRPSLQPAQRFCRSCSRSQVSCPEGRKGTTSRIPPPRR